MSKVNLVFATYNGINNYTKKRRYFDKERTLFYSLKKLLSLKHNLSQITVMKAFDPPEKNVHQLEAYYQLIEPLVKANSSLIVCEEVRNEYYSMSQWLKAYKEHPDFDYYLFIEDDYTPAIDNFDLKLIDLYKETFKNSIGVLSSVFIKNHSYPDHFDGLLFMSKETLSLLFEKHKMKENLFGKYLDIMKQRKYQLGHGGHNQVTFSLLFTEAGIKHVSIADKHPYLFWEDGGKIHIFDNLSNKRRIIGRTDLNDFEIIRKANILPTQLARNCVLVLSMHRSNSSMFSGCLDVLGLSYGKNIATVKNKFNKDGYFENMTIMHFNEKVLRAIGSSWYDIKPLTEPQIKKMLTFSNELKQILINEYADEVDFFVKDPRIVFLFPLYEKALLESNIVINVVTLQRDRNATCKSVERVQKKPFEYSLKLYDKHYHLIETNIPKKYRLLSFRSEDLIKDIIPGMKSFVKKMNFSELSPKEIQELRKFVKPEYITFKS